MENKPAVKASQLTVFYEKNPVLWDVDFSIPPGIMVGIIGPNGAGKSTLIKALLGLTPTISGSVSFFGQKYEEVKSKIAYVPQRESVDWNFPITVEELVLMGRYGKKPFFSRINQTDREEVNKVMALFEIEHLAKRQINDLSGGQQQRAFLARAMIQNADIYFLDEPFSGIDLSSEKIIVAQLKKLKEMGKTILIVHHDLSSVGDYFDWVMVLNLRLITCGKTTEAFTEKCLFEAYGRKHATFKEAIKAAREKESGATP